MRTVSERFHQKVDRSGDCWEWTACKSPDGYGRFNVRGEIVNAHRWAFEDANGYLPTVVRHTCDNPPCVNPDHLVAGTQADNVRDREDRGRGGEHKRRGTAHGMSKLTPEIIYYARGSAGLTHDELAELAGVSQSAISSAIRGATWGHLV